MPPDIASVIDVVFPVHIVVTPERAVGAWPMFTVAVALLPQPVL